MTHENPRPLWAMPPAERQQHLKAQKAAQREDRDRRRREFIEGIRQTVKRKLEERRNNED